MKRFITFEGMEGSGKSTQLGRAAEFLRAHGLEPLVTREPGGTPIGDDVRRILLNPAHTDMTPMTELLLVYAARVQHIEEVIQPALLEGRIVLCDRYEDSTVAYQGFGRGIPGNAIKVVSSLAVTGTQPGLTLLFDLPVEKGLERARSRNQASSGGAEQERLDREATEFHRRVREGYLEIARQQPGRFRVLDALEAPEKIARRVGHDLALFLKLSESS